MKKIEAKRREAKREPRAAVLTERELDVVAGGYGNINAF